MQEIFHALRRLDSGVVLTTKPEGTGLGLSIVRSLVAQQPGATIRVETKPGQGTTFILTMPVAIRAVPEARSDPPAL